MSAAADRIRLGAVNKLLCKLTTPAMFRCLYFRNDMMGMNSRSKDVQKSPEFSNCEEIDIVILDQEQLTWGTVGA
jgi:hypothetical protein